MKRGYGLYTVFAAAAEGAGGAEGNGDVGAAKDGAAPPVYVPPAEVENLDTLPEALRPFYVKNGDNKYRLEDPVATRRTRDAVLGEKKGLAKTIATLKAKGFDPEKLAAMETGEESIDFEELLKLHAAEKDRKAKGEEKDLSQIPEPIRVKWQAEKEREVGKERKLRETAETETAALRKELKSLKLDTRVRAVALKAGVAPEEIDDVMELTLPRHFDINEETDETIVKDRDGDPLPGMTVEKFWAEYYKERYPRRYNGDPTGGSGAAANNKGKLGGAKVAANLPLEERLTQAFAVSSGKT